MPVRATVLCRCCWGPRIRFIITGRQAFDEIPTREIFLANKRISECLSSGLVEPARKLFVEMRERDVITWNSMISGYRRNGLVDEAISMYIQMKTGGINGNAWTFSSILGVCTDASAVELGLQIHSLSIILGFELNLFVGSALVDFYMQCWSMDDAIKVFNLLPHKTVATWNSILCGYSKHGCSNELLDNFAKMRAIGVEPNGVTYCHVLHGCDHESLLSQGEQVHCHTIKIGLAESNLFISNALVDMYSFCSCLREATKSFEIIRLEDVISWNSVVSVYATHGYLLEAFELLSQMLWWGKSPTIHSLVELLNSSAVLQKFQLGEQIYGQIIKCGFGASVHIRSALINMYGKWRDIRSSEKLFDEVAQGSLVCSNALMCSYAQCGLEENAIELFKLILSEGLMPDQFTVSAVLKSCSIMATSDYGEQFHSYVIKTGLVDNMAVCISLIDSYSKSGKVELSRQIFDCMSESSTASITATISAYARNGLGREALELFEHMLVKGFTPDAVTLIAVLSACNHAGLVEEGLAIFELMSTCYGITPDRRHYSCIVNLLGRAGMLKEAEELMSAKTIEGDAELWSSVLGGCRIHGNLEVGERAAESLMELEPNSSAAYSQVCDLYCANGDLETAAKIRQLETINSERKDCAYSLIEIRS